MKHGEQGGLTIVLLVAAGLVLGCGPSAPATAGSSTGGGAEDTADTVVTTTTGIGPGASSSGSSEPPVDSSDATTSTTSTTSSSSGVDPDFETGCPGFLCHADGGGMGECNMWIQDCPAGEKCTPYATDGSGQWNAWRCVPVAADPDPAGAPCTSDGAASGVDSCELGAMCFFVDPETGMGTCTPHCTGTEQSPVCADPARSCNISGDGSLQLCMFGCDPLLQNCGDGEVCYAIDSSFACAPDASEDDRGLFAPCQFSNSCAAGLICVNPEVVGGCGAPPLDGCCSPACDLDDDACPDAMTCVPWFEPGQVPPGYEDVGVCSSQTE